MTAQQVRMGTSWSEVGSAYIDEFQSGSSNESKRLSALEISVLHMFQKLRQDTKDTSTWAVNFNNQDIVFSPKGSSHPFSFKLPHLTVRTC